MKGLKVALLMGMAAGQLAQGWGQPVPASHGAERAVSPSEQALRLYAALTRRTILMPGTLPVLPDSLPMQMMADTNGAVALVERTLAERHIEVVRDGDFFVRFLPEGWQESALAAQLLRIPSPPKRGAAAQGRTSAAVSIPAGVIDFAGADINQVLDVYSNLRNRTVLRPRRLSGPGFMLRTEVPLTHEEAVYALNVVLALNGFAAVEDGASFVQVVPIQQMALVKARAPKSRVTDPLITPEEVPVFIGERLSYQPPMPLPKASAVDAVRPPPAAATQPGVDELVGYYAKLRGQKASASAFHQQLVSFRVRSALTKAELLYAIETTLALDGLKIERQEDGTLQAVAR